MAIRVETFRDASPVLEQAGAFLASRPVVHNLMATLLQGRATHPEPGRYWVAWDGPDVVGVALQSPLDFPATLTPMPDAAVSAVVSTIAGEGAALGVSPTRSTGAWATAPSSRSSGTASPEAAVA